MPAPDQVTTRLRRLARAALGAALLASAPGCTHRLGTLDAPPLSTALTTPGPVTSMIYLARVDGGVVVLDLGWLGAERRLERGLARLGATPADVVAVFLTHGHRDHIGAWRAVRHAPLHMAAAEVEPFLGRARYRGLVPRLAERLRRTPRPAGGEVRAVGFARDTAFALGSDTLRAFLLAGHTRGSAAYLFRRVLFVGDALARPPLLGFRPAPAAFADEPHRAAASLESLWARVAPYRVDHVCTAHGKCAAFTERFRRKVSRAPRGPGG